MVESIEKGASGTARIAVGGSFFLFRVDSLEELGLDAGSLAPGTELDEESLGLLTLAASAYEAEKRALALLARAEQTRYLLAMKLEQRGFSSRALKIALDRLERAGLLDDRRFAEAWLRSRSGVQALSPAKLLAGLRTRGIEEALAKTVFREVFGADERRELLKKAMERELERFDGDRALATQALRKLGFKPGEIRELFS